jgi:hypothetical protein
LQNWPSVPSAKALHVAPISAPDARRIVARFHYSGKVVNNSQLHLGVFLDGQAHGVMSFGPSMDKRRMLPLVTGTAWNGMLELNRMAFSDALPRNSESRALSVAMRLIKKHYPAVEWVVSFADGTQCGDGTIYRASGFVLTQVKQNSTLWISPTGEVVSQMTLTNGSRILSSGGSASMSSRAAKGWRQLAGFQLRYIYFLNPAARARLTCPVLPFSDIERLGAGMYKGQSRARSKASVVPSDQLGEGGATPTRALLVTEGEQ